MDGLPDVGFVLVHGGFHRAACWDAVRERLGAPSVAVDLPGRGERAAVGRMSLDDFVVAVVEGIDRLPAGRVVVVGHSLAGVVIPEAARRRPGRVERLVFVAATIPPEGGAAVDTIPVLLRPVTRWQARTGRAAWAPRGVARFLFGHDLDATGRRLLLDQLSPESAAVGLEPVSRRGLRPGSGGPM